MSLPVTLPTEWRTEFQLACQSPICIQDKQQQTIKTTKGAALVWAMLFKVPVRRIGYDPGNPVGEMCLQGLSDAKKLHNPQRGFLHPYFIFLHVRSQGQQQKCGIYKINLSEMCACMYVIGLAGWRWIALGSARFNFCAVWPCAVLPEHPLHRHPCCTARQAPFKWMIECVFFTQGYCQSDRGLSAVFIPHYRLAGVSPLFFMGQDVESRTECSSHRWYFTNDVHLLSGLPPAWPLKVKWNY